MTNLEGKKSCKDKITRFAKIIFYLVLALLMVIFWPFWMLVKRFQNVWRASSGTTEERFDAKEMHDEDLIVSARAQIIEVAIESSFQPLLQLFLLLPTLLNLFKFYDFNETLSLFSPVDVFESVERRQFWSILTSIISLSWSFTFYQAVQKKGALNFGSNFSGRILLLVSNLLQLSTRLLVLVLYAYVCGNFWPMIVSVIIHIIIMSILHYFTSNQKEIEAFSQKPLTVGYHCLVNGISNLYLHNWISHIDSSNQRRKTISEVKKMKKNGTILRQTIFDTIILVENFVILVVAGIRFPECLTISFLISAGACQCIGLILKMVYYQRFHIWKDAITQQRSTKSIRQHVAFCSKTKGSQIYSLKNSSKREESIVMLDRER